jgi:hypothetical protein
MATTAFLLPRARFRAIHHHLWNWMASGFDGSWYGAIARHGYPLGLPPSHTGVYNWFPGFPGTGLLMVALWSTAPARSC